MPHRKGPVPLLVAAGLLALGLTGTSEAHDPIFGIGPHVIYRGGVGIEMELEVERASGAGEVERDVVLHTEVLYGATADFAVTLAVPAVLGRERGVGVSSGPGDLSLRAKYRFWRNDRPGIQDAAAAVFGVKLPTGDKDATPPLGSGSTDLLFGLAAARESRRWYYFADIRYRLNTENAGGLKQGDRFSADAAIGIRPRLTEYLEPDLVLTAELNWETSSRSEQDGAGVADSGGERLFFSPGFFLTYRNWAVKGAVQIPVYLALNGSQPEDDFRAMLAVETHF